MSLHLKRTFGFIVLFLILFDSPFVSSQTAISVGNQLTTYTSKVRGYHFTSPISFTICGLYVPDNASTGSQTVRELGLTQVRHQLTLELQIILRSYLLKQIMLGIT